MPNRTELSMSKITSNFALVLALICAAIKAKFSQPLIYSQDEPQAAYSPTRVFSPKEDEYFQRTLQSSVGQKGTFLTYTNAKLVGNAKNRNHSPSD